MTHPSTSRFPAFAEDLWGRGIRVRRLLGVVVAAAGLVVVAQPVSASAAEYQRTVRVNLSSAGAQADFYQNGTIHGPAISADGRYVAFGSSASNLVPADTNDTPDAFVRDVATGKTRRVSVSSTGAQGNDYSGGGGGGGDGPAISADGRYVAFISYASNLVSADTNGAQDVFVHDTATGKTRRVSVTSSGAQVNHPGFDLAISADGRRVAFTSGATDLVPADTNNNEDVFVHDMTTGRTRRVSVSSTGAQATPNDSMRIVTGWVALSADGRHVAFGSNAINLVPADTNDRSDVFVHDIATGKTGRASLSSTGAQTNGFGSWGSAISADGRHIAFTSDATNLAPGDTNDWADVYVHDRATGKTRRVSLSSTGEQFLDPTSGAAISADGRHIAFNSVIPRPTSTRRANLAPGAADRWSDVYVRDMTTGKTRRISVSSTGTQGNYDSSYPAISADGRHVAFGSAASNLVAGDTNQSPDVFLRHLGGW